jgi:hypothetical protein
MKQQEIEKELKDLQKRHEAIKRLYELLNKKYKDLLAFKVEPTTLLNVGGPQEPLKVGGPIEQLIEQGRVQFKSGMVRDGAQDKPRFDLIWPDCIPFKEGMEYRLAVHMSKGAAHYSETKEEMIKEKFIDFIIEELLCQNVENIQIERYMLKDTVDPAMKKDFVKIIQSSQKDKEEIEISGLEVILNDLKKLSVKELPIQNQDKGINTLNGLHHSEKQGLLRKQIIFFWKNKKVCVQSALSLLKNAQSVLIMTIQQNMQEDIYVLGAISDLECLMTLLRVLQEQLHIFKNLQLQNSLTQNSLLLVWISTRNWEKAKGQAELDRFRESARRHFSQWYYGELDEDHAAATFFNITGFEMVKSKIKHFEDTRIDGD